MFQHSDARIQQTDQHFRSERGRPHLLEMLQHSEVRIHEPINTVLQTALLLSFHLRRVYPTSDALFPADISEAVHGFFFFEIHGQLIRAIKLRRVNEGETNIVESWPFVIH
jgi:hypothetical protein